MVYDGRTDGWKKRHIEVGAPPKNKTCFIRLGKEAIKVCENSTKCGFTEKLFPQVISTSKKERLLFCSKSNVNFNFLCLVFIYLVNNNR